MAKAYTGQHEQLRAALQRTGYYPDLVAQALAEALADEQLISFLVHHEPTFEDEVVHRHQTVAMLTPSRLILAHTHEHDGDHLLPEPYTSTATEAVTLSMIKSVQVTRMVPINSTAPREVLLSIHWGAVSRLDLEPMTCADPTCEADHGLSGVLARDDFSLRVSEAADGSPAVAQVLEFAAALSRSARG